MTTPTKAAAPKADSAPAKSATDNSDAIDPTQKVQAQTGETGHYRVLTSAITVNNGLDPKKDGTTRVGRGKKVKLTAEIHDIGKLLALRAIEPWDDNKTLGHTSAAKLVRAANDAAEEESTDALPDGSNVEDGNAVTDEASDEFKNVEPAK